MILEDKRVGIWLIVRCVYTKYLIWSAVTAYSRLPIGCSLLYQIILWMRRWNLTDKNFIDVEKFCPAIDMVDVSPIRIGPNVIIDYSQIIVHHLMNLRRT